MALGGTLLIAGFVDLALLWFPLRFDSLAWEYATVGRSLDALPLPVLGIGIIAYAQLSDPRPGLGVTVALGGLALGVLVLAMAFLLATSAPIVLREASSDPATGVHRAVIRHAFEAVLYPAFLFFMARSVWKASR